MKAIIFSKKRSGLTLKKNETKVIIKVNKSLKNRGIFLKAITEKRGRQKREDCSIFSVNWRKLVYH